MLLQVVWEHPLWPLFGLFRLNSRFSFGVSLLSQGFFQDYSSVSGLPFLSRLCRSFFLKRPPVKTLLSAWSLPSVLCVLSRAPFEHLHKASLLFSVDQVGVSCGHCFWSQSKYPSCPLYRAGSCSLGTFRYSSCWADFIAKKQSPTSRSMENLLPSISSFCVVPE